jgi:tetratricopeptide (TPR) repeat protein
MMSGKYEQAWGRFQTYLRERRVAGPGQGELGTSFLWFHGLAAAHTRRYDEATDLFTQLIARSEKLREESEEEDLVRIPLRTNEYRYFLASIHQAAGEREPAIALYREAIESDLGLYMAHVQLANMYEATRNYPEALAERRAAVNANPDDPSLLMDLGVTLGKSGNVEEAQQVLRQAREANPRDPRVPFWLGLACLEAKRPAEAREALTTFLSMAPSRYERQIALAKQRLASLP